MLSESRRRCETIGNVSGELRFGSLSPKGVRVPPVTGAGSLFCRKVTFIGN